MIEKLKATVLSGTMVYWRTDDENCRGIISVGPSPSSTEGDDNWEPGPVGYFSDGTYIALWNCEPKDLVKVYPIFP